MQLTGLGDASTLEAATLAEELSLANEFLNFTSLLKDATYQRKEVERVRWQSDEDHQAILEDLEEEGSAAKDLGPVKGLKGIDELLSLAEDELLVSDDDEPAAPQMSM